MNGWKTLFYIFLLEFKRIVFGKIYQAEFDLTDNCNLRCKHCYHFHGKDVFKSKEVSLEVWEKRLRGLHRSGIRFLLIVGGEPALRNDVLMAADKMFPFIFVITNGTIKIPPEFHNRLFVSIDGNEKTNDSLRGKGVFSKVLKNYSGDRRVVINMTINRENYKELIDVVKISKENNFRGVICNICATGEYMDVPLNVTRKERKIIMKELRRVKSLYPDHFLLSKSMLKWYEIPNHSKSCYWGDGVLHFDVSWNKRRCFGFADCSNCGCFGGCMETPLRMILHPKEAIKIGHVK